jgi:hypothetical protein
MFKHANSVFPGDKVREVNVGKVATESRRGEVVDGGPDDRVRVQFEDGTTEWVPVWAVEIDKEAP